MRFLYPLICDEQQHRTGRKVDDPVQDALATVACDGDTNLLSAPTVTTIERRRLTDDDLVEHQDDCSFFEKKPVFQPPLACRQYLARKLNRWRGRFQLISKRISARLTEGRETAS